MGGEVITDPSGCRHCGVPQRGTRDDPRYHAQRWAEGVGWHGWTQPTQEQIKARMLARRAARKGSTMAGEVTPNTVVEVTANLEAYISERAQTKAEAALARARLEAAEQTKTVQTELDYEKSVVRELRRQLEAALRRPTRTEMEAVVRERGEAQAEADAERESNDALRKNRDQLNDELRTAHEALVQHEIAQRGWRKDVAAVETVRSRAEQWARSGSAAYAKAGRTLLDIVGPVTVAPGTPPAMTRCPHRDFDDPTRCLLCHP